MGKRFTGRGFAIGLAASLPAALFAQNSSPGEDVGTGTPPELRDFRLDQPPPRPNPEPTVAPPSSTQVEPPPPVPAIQTPPSDQRDTAQSRSAAPTRATEPRDDRQIAAESEPQSGTEADPTAAPDARDGVNGTISATTPATSPAKTAAVETPSAGFSFDPQILTWAAVAAALLAALIAAFFLWRRRKSPDEPQHDHDWEQQSPMLQPSPPTRLGRGTAAGMAEPDPIPAEPSTSTLTVAFEPTAAQLSIASLTVTGKLTVENRGSAPATGLALRSQMISAQDGQKEAIEAFHSNLSEGEIQSLGEMAAGERIDAIIEIRLPRAELHAFRWTEREFVAPIVLINVAGQMGEVPVEGRLSQLIGREGEVTSPRMKPLAIDRGPKRYSGVSARPVFA